jgi:hypothetical protein
MNEQQFDQQIKNKLAQQHFVPSQDGFAAIQQRVAQASVPIQQAKATSILQMQSAPRSFKMARRIAAVLLPFIAVGSAFYIWSNKNVPTDTTIASTTNTIDTFANTATATNVVPAADQIQTITNAKINTTKTQTIAFDNGPAAINPNFSKQINKKNSEEIYPKQNTISLPIVETKIVKNKIENNIEKANEQIINENFPNQKEIIAETKSIELQKNNIEQKQYLPLELPNTNSKKTLNKKTGLCMIAGAVVNSNNSNSNSFQLGFSAQKNINRRLYVDAAVIVSRNNPTWLQNQLATTQTSVAMNKTSGYTIVSNRADAADEYINAYGVNPATNTFKAGGNNISLAELGDEQSIADAAAYRLASTQIEAAPMIGFRALPRLNIAAGADAVHILQTNTYTDATKRLLLQSQQNPTMKTWDMGVLGKIEYQINNRIIVGYRHRQGLTSMTPNSATNTRRNYNGVMVRFKLL